MSRLQAIRGMNDLLPAQSAKWRQVEASLIQVLYQYSYEEIRFPLLESTQLFKRTIGEVTDIVEKEMYTFIDRNEESVTLRPEGTAGCIRACLEHGLLYNQTQRLWYLGPMFRHEKPQKGRYRQFTQLGIEALGFNGTAIELELLSINQRFWKMLGLDKLLRLELNTLGTLEERKHYRQKLVEFFTKQIDVLDAESKHRLEKNPLRILDSKREEMQPLIEKAPKFLDFLGLESGKRFDSLCKGLEDMGIPFVLNPRLVRGLDYYGHTVFEWVHPNLGSQATLSAGGRYDALTKQLGGQETPAVGCAIGLDRLLLALEATKEEQLSTKNPFCFLMTDNECFLTEIIKLAEELRDANQNWSILVNPSVGSFKSQFKKADKSGAALALILGENETNNQEISVKHLRQEMPQTRISRLQLIDYLQSYFHRMNEKQEA